MAVNGSVWVEGTELHYLTETGVEKKAAGTDNGVVAGAQGSLWIEGTQLHYIDNTGHERILPYTSIGANGSGLAGSIWVETGLIHYIVAGNEDTWHTDQTNASHQDTAYSNWTNYSNGYGDWTDSQHSDHWNWLNNYEYMNYWDAMWGIGNTHHYDGVSGNIEHYDVHIDGHANSHTDQTNATHQDTAYSNWTNYTNTPV